MSESIFCPLRKKWVSALPEEKIRQALIREMIQHLGYPLGNIVLERNLRHLPNLTPQLIPRRRADLIVYAKNLHPKHSLYPLLLIECKAVPLTEVVIRQIVGYNHYIQAYFIAAVNLTKSFLGWYNHQNKDYIFQEGLLTYRALIFKAQELNTINFRKK